MPIITCSFLLLKKFNSIYALASQFSKTLVCLSNCSTSQHSLTLVLHSTSHHHHHHHSHSHQQHTMIYYLLHLLHHFVYLLASTVSKWAHTVRRVVMVDTRNTIILNTHIIIIKGVITTIKQSTHFPQQHLLE